MIGLKARLAVGGVLIAAAFYAGWTVASWRAGNEARAAEKALQRVKDAAQAEAVRITALRRNNALLAQAAGEAQRAQLQEFDINLQRRITRYVQTPAATECDLDGGWVREHNYAARGAVSGATPHPPPPGQDPAGASRGDVLEAVTINYRLYHRLKSDYTELLGFCKSNYVGIN